MMTPRFPPYRESGSLGSEDQRGSSNPFSRIVYRSAWAMTWPVSSSVSDPRCDDSSRATRFTPGPGSIGSARSRNSFLWRGGLADQARSIQQDVAPVNLVGFTAWQALIEMTNLQAGQKSWATSAPSGHIRDSTGQVSRGHASDRRSGPSHRISQRSKGLR